MAVKVHFQLLALVLAAALSFGAVKYINSQNSRPQAARLPEIYFYDKSDRRISLDSLKGKPLLVNLWASWCVPCIAELPSLGRLQAKLPEVKVVAISMDKISLKDIRTFLDKNGAKNMGVYWDKDRQIPLKWKYEGLPTSFLLNNGGVIAKQYDGPYEWDQEPLVTEIRVLLAK